MSDDSKGWWRMPTASELVLALFRPLVVLVTALLIGRIVAWDATMTQVWFDTLVPYWFVPIDVGLVAALLVRRWYLASACGALVVAQAALVLPGNLAASPDPGDLAARARIRVMSANLLMVNPDVTSIADEILASDADVVLLQEYSSRWKASLGREALLAKYPHRIEHVRDDSFGVAIFSARPFEAAWVENFHAVPLAFARVDVGGRPLTFADVHTLPPANAEYTAVWREQLAALPARLAAVDGAVVLGGDLNATVWHRPFVGLLGRLRDAHVDRGRSLAVTWPNGTSPVPPTRLDHLLVTPDIAVVSITEGIGAGSDHRPLIADLAL